MSTNGASRPSKLHISTQAVVRLLKERDYYLKDLEGEKATAARLREQLQQKIADGVTPEENEEFLIDQRVCSTPLSTFANPVHSPLAIVYPLPRASSLRLLKCREY